MKLGLPIKFKLSSPNLSKKIVFLEQKFQFEQTRLQKIIYLIEEYYFGEIRFENFPREIEKRMGVSLLTAQEITRYLKQEVIDWDPWGEYLAGLPKMPIREIVQKHPKIVNMEITKGYIDLRGSEYLEDPTIKNWLKDFVSHLGYEKHSQMQRAEYLFHSENGKDLDSLDREKLSIILKSFDENVPLAVDEENGEIVFESVISDQRTVNNNPTPAAVPKSQPTPIKQDSFIKPYAPISPPQRQAPRPAPVPILPPRPQPIQTSPQPLPHREVQSTSNNPEIDKYFNASEYPAIPSIKIHSITEHNEPKIQPQQAPPQMIPSARRTIQSQQQEARPQHRIIEPRLDGNIVDLSDK